MVQKLQQKIPAFAVVVWIHRDLSKEILDLRIKANERSKAIPDVV
jgi:hypothetical protein